VTDEAVGSLNSLLEFVRDSRGFDFTGYKRSSIERRVAKRMGEVGVDAGRYDQYVEYLEVHSGEFAELFNTLLINVTGFFRDPPIWEHMATTVVPALLSGRPSESPLRVWCAGCASGEEAYTVAMVLARVLGDSDFKDRVKIYATDVDEEALDHARQGAYLPRQIEDVPRDALERFFERTDQRYVFRKDLRRCVIFGRNDLVQDAPISRIDLLVCRNTLMYFTAETQAQTLRRFHFALDNDGVLMLGKSEMLITHSDLFTPVDLKWRVFRKVMRSVLRDRVRVMAADPGNGASQSVTDNLREAAYDTVAPANLVLDSSGALVMANEDARRLFGLGITDFGRPIQDLELSYRPLELRSHLEAVSNEGRAAEITGVRWRQNDQERVIDVRLTPLMNDGAPMGTSITYIDATEGHRLNEELSTSRRELESAYEALQSTVEELETTNEELQSTNEELETTNEELQSTNEELETMNEELQSSNEELETINDELRHRTLELSDMNSFLETILTTIGMAVIVVDPQQHVQIWNAQAKEMWGLTSEEAEDQHLLSLDIGLPVEQLKGPVRAALSGEDGRQEVILPATNRRGRSFQCHVSCLPLGARRDGNVSGVIIMMEPVEEDSE
jgi:two-component system CheB/CheR fusion protein